MILWTPFCLEVICWSASNFFVFVLVLSSSNKFADADVWSGAKHEDMSGVLDRTERLRVQHPWLSCGSLLSTSLISFKSRWQ